MRVLVSRRGVGVSGKGFGLAVSGFRNPAGQRSVQVAARQRGTEVLAVGSEIPRPDDTRSAVSGPQVRIGTCFHLVTGSPKEGASAHSTIGRQARR